MNHIDKRNITSLKDDLESFLYDKTQIQLCYTYVEKHGHTWLYLKLKRDENCDTVVYRTYKIGLNELKEQTDYLQKVLENQYLDISEKTSIKIKKAFLNHKRKLQNKIDNQFKTLQEKERQTNKDLETTIQESQTIEAELQELKEKKDLLLLDKKVEISILRILIGYDTELLRVANIKDDETFSPEVKEKADSYCKNLKEREIPLLERNLENLEETCHDLKKAYDLLSDETTVPVEIRFELDLNQFQAMHNKVMDKIKASFLFDSTEDKDLIENRMSLNKISDFIKEHNDEIGPLGVYEFVDGNNGRTKNNQSNYRLYANSNKQIFNDSIHFIEIIIKFLNNELISLDSDFDDIKEVLNKDQSFYQKKINIVNSKIQNKNELMKKNEKKRTELQQSLAGLRNEESTLNKKMQTLSNLLDSLEKNQDQP